MKKKLLEIRNDAVRTIKLYLSENNLDEIRTGEIDDSDSPIVLWGEDDSSTYTLDRIHLDTNGTMLFDASSCWANGVWEEDEVDTDELVGIVEWLEEHEEEIKDYATI